MTYLDMAPGDRIAYRAPGLPGQTSYRPMDAGADDFAVWLPHSCDEWIIGCGTPEQVIEQVAALRDDLNSILAIIAKGIVQ